MKKFLGVSLILALLAPTVSFGADDGVVTLDKNSIEKPSIAIEKGAKQLQGSLLVSDSEDLAQLIDTQKDHDIKDLEQLWKGTVENNQVIEFALKKLATPESQRRIHSSLMAKTLSAVVTGASFVPSLMGANYGIQTSAFSAGRLAQGLINRKNVPQETPLTDTELIELASMIEDLQDSLISSYYNYKNTLTQLKDTRSKMILYSRNYSKALEGGDVLEIAISSSLYDSMRIQEFNLEQSAKKYHIQLQRLAGKKIVDSLELYQYDFNSVLYKNGETKDGGKKNDKNKILSTLLLISMATSTILPTFAEVKMEDLNSPKDAFFRLGTTDIPENKIDVNGKIDIKANISKEEKFYSEGLTYADLSIKKMALEVSKSVEVDYNEMLEDLSLLWQGAATKSDTIKFAIYKLSNPDKDKPDQSAVKKVLTTIAGMSTFLGAGMGNPVLASAALIGGNTLGIMSQDTKALNYKYSQVNDADMILLVRKVDELQQKVVDMYYDYMTARQLYDMTTEMVEQRRQNYQNSQKSKKEVILITDTFYREAMDEQIKARGNFFEKRSRLEQLVGNDVFRQFETIVDERYAKK